MFDGIISRFRTATKTEWWRTKPLKVRWAIKTTADNRKARRRRAALKKPHNARAEKNRLRMSGKPLRLLKRNAGIK